MAKPNQDNKEQDENDNAYNKFASGIIIVKSENSNFNADFTHTPRRLPDENGTIYATDKSLKYCIRKQLKDNNLNEKIFVWRRKDDKGDPCSIDENYNQVFGTTKLPTDRSTILRTLLQCLDIKLFGITFAPSGQGQEGRNVSITGPVQISYGINKFRDNIHYTNQILSPYQPKGGGQTTIGEEAKALESHYVFDFIVNPNHLKDSTGHLSDDNQPKLTCNDIKLFKEASRKGVSSVNSTTKIGSENELLIYIEYDKPVLLQNLKDFISIEKTENEIRIDLKRLLSYLFEISSVFSHEEGSDTKKPDTDPKVRVEVYYEPQKVKIDIGAPKQGVEVELFNLITGKEIKIII